MPGLYATADIGSNTCHLLVAEWDGRELSPRVNVSEWLSLGEAVTRDGEFTVETLRALLTTLKRFWRLADQAGANHLYVFATEAVRMAANHEAVLRRIRETTGIQVEVISPRREAELSLGGIRLDTVIDGEFTLMEVGGGSAQVAECVGREMEREVGLPIGTGRLTAEYGLSQPCAPEAVDRLERDLVERLRGASLPTGRPIVASGGVARGLIRALHPDGARRIELFEIEYLVKATMVLDQATISRRFNVKPKRAATLLPGALVYRALLRACEEDTMLVSECGVREGAILEMSQKAVKA